MLTDRAQVFLPTNNALSPVGHVHWYLEEIGQGVQHVASRVASLPAYVQRANQMRAVTGEGVTFLNIPRTYYGLLEPESLVSVDTELRRDGCPSGLAEPLALELVAALRAAGPPRATHVGRAAGGTVRDTSTPCPAQASSTLRARSASTPTRRPSTRRLAAWLATVTHRRRRGRW